MSENEKHDPNQMTGAAMIVRALADHGVQHIFGYPGGAVLPIYDEIFQLHRQAGRRAGDLGTGRDQHGDAAH